MVFERKGYVTRSHEILQPKADGCIVGRNVMTEKFVIKILLVHTMV